ncbi:MAG: hypothetical protein K0A99_07275 [Desulfoarculaceae bacterium]|nr:hypothetical protein [Desulfoarculaceae bacterium]
MQANWEIIGREGFKFYGKMSASISHEIKNILAIINENAGLLSDFTMMAERGVPIEPERLNIIAAKIGEQVKRADLIVRNMNQFAHSVDEQVKTVPLDDLIAVVIKLSLRFAANRGVHLEHQPADSPVSITTSPFLLKNLAWLCLDQAMDAVGEKKIVSIVAKDEQNGVMIKFKHSGTIQEKSTPLFPGEQENALVTLLRAEMEINNEAGELTLHLPASLDK